jgi:hypothetical protein
MEMKIESAFKIWEKIVNERMKSISHLPKNIQEAIIEEHNQRIKEELEFITNKTEEQLLKDKQIILDAFHKHMEELSKQEGKHEPKSEEK